MQTHGDIEQFKKAISESFAKKLDDHKAQLEEAFLAKKQKVDAQKKQIQDTYANTLTKQKEILQKRILADEMLLARLEIEKEKRQIFEEILSQTLNMETDFYASPKFIAYVQSFNPQEIRVAKATYVPKSVSFAKKVIVSTNDTYTLVLANATVDVCLQNLLQRKKVDAYILLDAFLFGDDGLTKKVTSKKKQDPDDNAKVTKKDEVSQEKSTSNNISKNSMKTKVNSEVAQVAQVAKEATQQKVTKVTSAQQKKNANSDKFQPAQKGKILDFV
jgi:hypothetical protein